MLDEAFSQLSPVLVDRYRDLLDRECARSPELAELHQTYVEYALRDKFLPRPVLAYIGYHARSHAVDFTVDSAVADGLLIPQLLRDVLAIHDDIVDEDLDKFGAPPLPVQLSTAGGGTPHLTKHGKDLALYYGDFLIGVMLRVAGRQPAHLISGLTRLIADTLYVNQRGQLAELLTENRPVADTTVEDLLLVGERKAAHYCYAFPFALGAILAGHPPDIIEAVQPVLVRIGTASQVVDDITGTFPGVLDHDKDTLGEIANLRRTVPLVLLAHEGVADATSLLAANPPLDGGDARRLRELLWNSNVPTRAVELCDRLLNDIHPRLDSLPIAEAARTYLRDLVEHRLRRNVERLRSSIREG